MMSQRLSVNFPTVPLGPVGYLSNGGSQRYLLEAESTSGFVAWRLADGTTLVSEAMQISLAASPAVAFWACAGVEDTSHAGRIISLDCHGNGLTHLDVTALTGLEFLDCCYNELKVLAVAGLAELQALDVAHNQLTTLDVSELHALRMLNCAGNWIRELDLTGLDLLEVMDCTGNPLHVLKTEGCTSLKETKR